jgi:hypothetical protein
MKRLNFGTETLVVRWFGLSFLIKGVPVIMALLIMVNMNGLPLIVLELFLGC